MRELSCEQAGARGQQAHELHGLPCSARGWPGQGVRLMSRRREGRAPSTVVGRWSSGCLRGLPSSARPRRRTEGCHLRELSRQAAPRDREVPRLPWSTCRKAGAVGSTVCELSCREGANHRLERASRLRGLPQASRACTVDTGSVVRDVSRTDRGEHESRAWSLRELPHRWRPRAAASAAGLRVLSYGAGVVGPEGTPGLRDVPRAAQRQASPGRDVRELSCGEGERQQAHGVCELSSPARSERHREAAGVRDLPCTGDPTGPASRHRPRPVRELSSVARSGATRRPNDLPVVPQGPAQSRADGDALRRLSPVRRRSLIRETRRFCANFGDRVRGLRT